jgi:hypothetical protein
LMGMSWHLGLFRRRTSLSPSLDSLCPIIADSQRLRKLSLWDSEPRETALARVISNCEIQTPPLLMEGTHKNP